MLKKIRIMSFAFMFVFFTFFFYLENINADNYDGYGGDTGGIYELSSGNWNLSDAVGLRFTIKSKAGDPSDATNRLCTFAYNRSDLINKLGFNFDLWWKYNSKEEKIDLAPTVLYNFLNIPPGKPSNYAELVDILNKECGTDKLNAAEYIYIEPYARRKGTAYTLHDFFGKIFSDMIKNDGLALRALANAASTGKNVEGYYTEISKSCQLCGSAPCWSFDARTYCYITAKGGPGYGVLEIKATDIPKLKNHSITIIKKNQNGKLMKDVTIKLLDDEGNVLQTNTTNANGRVIFSNLSALPANKKYIIQEIVPVDYITQKEKSTLSWEDDSKYKEYKKGSKTPDSYTDNTVSWEISTFTSDRTFTITNLKDTCESEFKALKDKGDIKERIKLYNKYKVNSLLNLNYNNADNACKPTTCKKTISAGCLAAKGSLINKNDFSCYDFSFSTSTSASKGNFNIYCVTNFELGNLFSDSGTPSFGNFKFPSIKSGQLIVNVKNAAELNLTTYCLSPYSLPSTTSIGKFKDFVSDIEFSGESLKYVAKKESIGISSYDKKTNGFTYTFNASTNFELPKVYASLLEGKIKYDNELSEDDLKSGKYRDIGYGIISNLDAKDSTNKAISYSITFSKKIADSYAKALKNGVYQNTKACTYSIKNDIVEEPEDPTNLNLEFREIDTSNPFPGKDGTGRKIGSNWCIKDSECASNNILLSDNILMSYITDRVNSYGRVPSTGQTVGPKYTIRLTPSDIKQIRKYNDDVGEYQDFSLTCKEDETKEIKCTSNVLESMRSGLIGGYSLSNTLKVIEQ